MNPKPGDLMLNVIDFFGILIPGAVLVFLYGNFLLSPLGLSVGGVQSLADWIPAFFISFVLGHILLGLSVNFNEVAAKFLSPETKAYYGTICPELPQLPGIRKDLKNVFYTVSAYIRIKSPEAIAEIDRQMAEYKLFRSLILLFLLDIPLSAITGAFSIPRLAISLLIVCLAAYRFHFLFDWTYRLAFNFYLQLQPPGGGGKPPMPAP